MKKRTKRLNRSRGYSLIRALVVVSGFILALVLHEGFHILMHWGHITHIELFPSLGTIVKIDADIPPGYDLDAEEMVAYGITLIVIFLTIVLTYKIRDSEDKRTASQILFPRNKEMQNLGPSKLLELLDKNGKKRPAPVRSRKRHS